MSSITTHILDTTSGKPGAGIAVVLERKTHTAGWQALAEQMSDIDGRVDDLLSKQEAFLPGHYRLIFEVAPYFLVHDIECFFPTITINFVVKDPAQRFHVPLLLSPFGYTTYRSSQL
ncbi:MAG: hydroxyisourate hydrolase [Pyrinomonadaceae bacterium]